jgi:hypothetical protein
MNTYTSENKTTFIYNSDFSNNAKIIYNNIEIDIPSDDILEFVSQCYIRNKKISELENTNWKNLI